MTNRGKQCVRLAQLDQRPAPDILGEQGLGSIVDKQDKLCRQAHDPFEKALLERVFVHALVCINLLLQKIRDGFHKSLFEADTQCGPTFQ